MNTITTKARVRLGWRAGALSLAAMTGITAMHAACSTTSAVVGDTPPGTTSAGGTGGGGSSVGGEGGAGGASASSGGGGSTLCGNGQLDTGENCDGEALGGATCSSLGFGDGELSCSSGCGFVVVACGAKELCNDGYDNDHDSDVDCDDGDCNGAAACVDGCATPLLLTDVLGVVRDTTIGRADTLSNACAQTSGGERVYRFVAPATTTLGLRLTSDVPMSLAVRTVCADAQSALSCSDDDHCRLVQEHTKVEVVGGDTYFVIVDGAPGAFELEIAEAEAVEISCGNGSDDDFDCHVDCDDADCRATAACDPGSAVVGEMCGQHADCSSAAGDDPHCHESAYCSEYCDLASPDCAPEAICTPFGRSQNGLCLRRCDDDTDCAPGLSVGCVDAGLASRVCLHAELSCADGVSDDGDVWTDCEDTDCQQYTSMCQPGAGEVGEACTQATDCAANALDPVCLGASIGDSVSFVDGYCSEFCNPLHGDCAEGSVCAPWLFLPSFNGLCMKACSTNSDCRIGYSCQALGPYQPVCFPVMP